MKETTIFLAYIGLLLPRVKQNDALLRMERRVGRIDWVDWHNLWNYDIRS